MPTPESLSPEIKAQLTPAFSKLTNSIQYVLHSSEHPSFKELHQLLNETATTHERITVEVSKEETSSTPFFEIHKNHTPTGISFLGIPTGHEFSSLIIATLNADLKGQLPDDATLARIRTLPPDLELKTFISLSCTNCPLIVQAFNLMSAIHPTLRHTMIDGTYLEKELQRLDVNSVPSTYYHDELLHAGRATFGQLLDKLEQRFRATPGTSTPAADPPSSHRNYDVIVVGGGPAGISSAIYSARKGLKTAVVADALGGQLLETQGIENFISVLYTEGAKLAHNLAQHLKEYPVDILEHRRVKTVELNNEAYPDKKFIKLNTPETLAAEQVIVATGARWRELGIPGEKPYLGKGVAYCPHCDGPYFKGKDVIVVGGGNSGVEAAIDLSGIVRSVALFEFQDTLKADQVLQNVLKERDNTKIFTSVAVKEVKGDGKSVSYIIYEDSNSGTEHTFETSAVFVQIGLLPNSQFLGGIVDTNNFGEIIVDAKNRTSVPGIYATGDVSSIPYKQIIISMGDGAKAALAAFEDSITKKAN